MTNIATIGLGFGPTGSGPDPAPTTPTFTLALVDITVTATIAGDAAVINTLYYKKSTETAWTTDTRSGDGDIVVAGLERNVLYDFTVQSFTSGANYSAVAVVQHITIGLESSTTGNCDSLDIESARQAMALLCPENVTYYPKAGGSRDILGLVDRDSAASLPSTPHGNSPVTTIVVLNSSTDGISMSEIDKNKDKIGYEVRIGWTAQARKIIDISESDDGMIELVVA